MCEMITALTALQIASAGAGLVAQQQAYQTAKASASAQNEATMRAYQANMAQNDLLRNQERENLSERINENNRALRRAQATTYTSAGEAGISGMSVDALLMDLSGQAGRDNTTATTNYMRQDMQLQTQAENIYANTRSQLSSIQSPKMPDYLGTGLKILDAYDNYKNPRVRRS